MRSSVSGNGLILLLALAGCGHDAPPLVAFAYARNGAPYLDLARAGFVDAGRPAPAFLYDSTADVGTAEQALAFAAQLVGRRDVTVVVGPSNSREALATAPAYVAAGLPVIVPSATSRRLRSAAGTLFTLAPDDSVEGAFLARFAARQLRARRGVIFYANDEYGEGLRTGITDAFTTLGGTVAEAVPVGGSVADPAALLAATLRRAHPEVIFSAARAEATGALLRAAHALAPGVPVVAGDGAYLPPALASAAGGDLRDLYVLAFWSYDSTVARQREFVARVRRLRGTAPMPEDALTVDALGLAVAALDAVGPDRERIRRWLRELGRTHPAYPGLTGPISFGAERALPLRILRFEDGRAVAADSALVGAVPAR